MGKILVIANAPNISPAKHPINKNITICPNLVFVISKFVKIIRMVVPTKLPTTKSGNNTNVVFMGNLVNLWSNGLLP